MILRKPRTAGSIGAPAPSSPAAPKAQAAGRSGQPSKLLQSLLEGLDPEQRYTVLHLGPAAPETIDFFCDYRCKLFFVDLIDQLEEIETQDPETSLEPLLAGQMQIPLGTRLDLCLFWDQLNYLDTRLLAALARTIEPHLHAGTRAHGFAVHNARAARLDRLYAIGDAGTLVVRPREPAPPNYHPQTQGSLGKHLHCFNFDRTVLLAEGQLEWIASARGSHLRQTGLD